MEIHGEKIEVYSAVGRTDGTTKELGFKSERDVRIFLDQTHQ